MSVVLLAGIAAVISYQHMYALALQHGETQWAAALLPLSVDGMIAASSMSLLLDSRYGRRGGLLPWSLLVVGSAASLSANVAVAEPSVVGRLIAAWPSFALIGSYEMLMRQVRYAADHPHPVGANGAVSSYGPHMAREGGSEGSDDTQTQHPASLIRLSSNGSHRKVSASGQPEHVHQAASQNGINLQQRAWEWALANRTPKGDLPSGKAIAKQFNRRERWGRLVKQSGRTGGLDSVTAR